MKFRNEILKIRDLINLYENNKLNLSPPYQRNEIWSTKAKQLLIDSIKRNFPLPSFFVREQENNMWEMVDGQQRSRTIIAFVRKQFPYSGKIFYDENTFPQFLDFKLSLTIITELDSDETIEEFYVRVNSTGLKINRPELKKAEYFETNFSNLLNDLANYENFKELQLFTNTALNRMNDIDLVSELIAQLKFGETEKKDAVDKLYENDINQSEYSFLQDKFLEVIEVINEFNRIYPIKKTRYKQRNDFYTLFGFISKNLSLSIKSLIYFYKILVLIEKDIKPYNEDCEPFMEYAQNCVSQSNSKQARINRISFFNKLFLNQSTNPNIVQKEVMNYYGMDDGDLVDIEGFLVLNINSLQKKVEFPQIAS